MQKLILISLILLISSKELKFNTETAYNTESDNTFELTNDSTDGFIFVYVSCVTTNTLTINYGAGNSNSGRSSCNKPGEGILLYPSNDKYVITMKASGDKKDSGTIWVNPTEKEIEVDLSKKYEGKFPIITTKSGLTEPYPELTYAINDVAKDVTFSFKYTDKENELRDETIPNPIKICQDNICFPAPETYEFEEGESYKIKVRMQEVDYDVVLPKFSFADVNYKESSGGNGENNDSYNLRFNLLIVSLLIILL